MVIFPSSESQTDSVQPPWAALVLSLLASLGYIFLMLPQKREYQAQKNLAKLKVDQSLERHYLQGLLPQSFYRDAQDSIGAIGRPENKEIYSAETWLAYQEYINLPRPHQRLQNKGPLWRLLALFIPNEWPVLLMGILGLITLGFLFEHVFDRQLLPALFVISAFGWLPNWPLLPDDYQPNLIFAWGTTVSALLLAMWLCFPKSNISLTIHIWLIKIFTFKPTIPSGFIAVIFVSGMLIHNQFFSADADYFNAKSVLPATGEGLIFALLLSLIARRKREHEDPEQVINRRIATAESLFDQERPEEAFRILKDLLNAEPDLRQVRHIAEVAWRHHDNEIARQSYHLVLKEVTKANDHRQLIELIEEMVYRDIPVAAHILHGGVTKGFKHGMLAESVKLLPFLEAHPEIPMDQVVPYYERLGVNLINQHNPDRQMLFLCQSWLEEHSPEAKVLEEIRDYLHSTSVSQMAPMEADRRISRRVDIELLDIHNGAIKLRVTGGKEQVVPWTAIEGIFGCHVASGARGYYGCIFLKFKRKIYACNFNRQSIMMKDRYGQSLAFESTWSRLEQYVPEDIPFIKLEDFPELLDTEDIAAQAEAFFSR